MSDYASNDPVAERKRMSIWWKLAYIYLAVGLIGHSLPALSRGLTEGGPALLDGLFGIVLDCISVYILFGVPRIIWLCGCWLYRKTVKA